MEQLALAVDVLVVGGAVRAERQEGGRGGRVGGFGEDFDQRHVEAEAEPVGRRAR